MSCEKKEEKKDNLLSPLIKTHTRNSIKRHTRFAYTYRLVTSVTHITSTANTTYTREVIMKSLNWWKTCKAKVLNCYPPEHAVFYNHILKSTFQNVSISVCTRGQISACNNTITINESTNCVHACLHSDNHR